MRDRFVGLVDGHPELLRLHDPDLAAVVFLYVPSAVDVPVAGDAEVERLNEVSLRIHTELLASGDWHLHQFTLPDDTGRVRRGVVLRPLRLLAGNPRTTDADLRGVLDAVVSLGRRHWAATA